MPLNGKADYIRRPGFCLVTLRTFSLVEDEDNQLSTLEKKPLSLAAWQAVVQQLTSTEYREYCSVEVQSSRSAMLRAIGPETAVICAPM